MKITDRSKRYISVNNRHGKETKKADELRGVDSVRADTWTHRAEMTADRLEAIEADLTPTEKEQIEDYYQCEIF